MIDPLKFIDQAVEEIRKEAEDRRVVMALSGGVDSSVCAALAARVIGDRLEPIYVDTGLMRKGETERIAQVFGNLRLHIVPAADEFFAALKGVVDHQEHRTVIRERFRV